MGLRDILSGRKKLKDPARERLFAISTARITLQTELDLKPSGSAGVCFKPLSAGEFVRAENDLQQVLDAVAAESGSRLERKSDDYGYEWIVVRVRIFDFAFRLKPIGSAGEACGSGRQYLAGATSWGIDRQIRRGTTHS